MLAAAFIGGPMAMVYVLWRNFQTLENPHGMRQVLLFGALFVAALLIFAPLMSTDWPDYVLPFAYSAAGWSLADKFQLSKRAIRDSEAYEFQSVWTVIAVSIVFLIAMIVVAFVWFFGLAALGLIGTGETSALIRMSLR